MKLINADAFRRVMYHEAYETNTGEQEWNSGLWIRYSLFERNLMNAPTLDAVPAVHGHWEWEDGNCIDRRVGAWKCSLCKCENRNIPEDKNVIPSQCVGANFCPHCGAVMD